MLRTLKKNIVKHLPHMECQIMLCIKPYMTFFLQYLFVMEQADGSLPITMQYLAPSGARPQNISCHAPYCALRHIERKFLCSCNFTSTSITTLTNFFTSSSTTTKTYRWLPFLTYLKIWALDLIGCLPWWSSLEHIFILFFLTSLIIPKTLPVYLQR